MNYELAKQLKESGFPQQKSHDCCFEGCCSEGKTEVWFPTLSELIGVCGRHLLVMEQSSGRKGGWTVKGCIPSMDISTKEYETGEYIERKYFHGTGSSLEEAVANLWLILNKK